MQKLNQESLTKKTHTVIFLDNIPNMKNPHIRCVSLGEKYGTIKDYSSYHKQLDLENYKNSLNSHQYDHIREIEPRIKN